MGRGGRGPRVGGIGGGRGPEVGVKGVLGSKGGWVMGGRGSGVDR